MRSGTKENASLRSLAIALFALASLLPSSRAQEPFEPFPWQWSSIEQKVERAQASAGAILQHWTATIDPRSVRPEQYAISLELHTLVTLLELDLRYLRAELALNSSSEWYAHATDVVQRRIEVHGKRLGDAWNQHLAWRNAIVPHPSIPGEIQVLLAHLSRVEGELGLCDYWNEGRNTGSIRALFAEIDRSIPYRNERGVRVYEVGQSLFLRTGFVLEDGRRVDTARRMRLDGVAGERVEGGFRLGTLGAGTYRAIVTRRSGQSVTAEFVVREDALRLALLQADPNQRVRGRVLLQVTQENGTPFLGGNVSFALEQETFRDRWRPVPARIGPADRGATYELLDLTAGTYRVQARAPGFAPSEFVRFELMPSKLVVEFVERGGRGRFGEGFSGFDRWKRFRVLADGVPLEEGLRFESESLLAGSRWQPANLEPRTGRVPGSFVLEEPPSGRHRLRASADRYETSDWVEFEVTRPALALTVLQVEDGVATFSVAETERRFQPACRFDLQRQVGGLQWQPLSLNVEMLREAGRYRVGGLSEGTHRVRVQAEGFEASPWVTFEVRAMPGALFLDLPERIYDYGDAVTVGVGANRGRLDCAGVVLAVQMQGGRSGYQPCNFVQVTSGGACRYTLTGFRPNLEYRIQAVDRAGRHASSDWVMLRFRDVPPPSTPTAIPIVPENARNRTANVHFKEGNWDKNLGEVLLRDEDRARRALGFELTAEKNEFLCVNLIVVEGLDDRNQPRTYTFFEPYMYDVSRHANRGYGVFEYVTPGGRRQGDGVYVSPNAEVPEPLPGMLWPQYSRSYLSEHAKVRNPKYAYPGTNKVGRDIDGQNGIIKETKRGREEKGTIRFLLPEALRVQRIQVRYQAREGTEASVKMIVLP